VLENAVKLNAFMGAVAINDVKSGVDIILYTLAKD
jgi:hypothetical protein